MNRKNFYHWLGTELVAENGRIVTSEAPRTLLLYRSLQRGHYNFYESSRFWL